ncbi:MAG: protein-export chaperone SecB [Holosporaceae bacterium]|jgi:preprotein translocase subunit SecB|nr:protein-export chaperone SecB [Holosporaceae bacterium]
MAKKEEPVLGIRAQYVKDLSFENINSVSRTEAGEEDEPKIDMRLKVNVEKGDEANLFEVSLITKIDAKLKKPLFILELNYTGEFIVEGFSPDDSKAILYTECPRLLFPFARSIVANTVADGGFPPLYLAPVDFANLYRQQDGPQDDKASKK